MENYLSNFSSAFGSTGRVIAVRILPGLDVLGTLEEICFKHDIKYGQITTSIGSLRRISLNYVSRLTPAEGQGYTTHMEKEGPFSVLCGQGLVSPGNEPNKMNIHYHAVLSGENDIVYGGHIERGTVTLTTLDVFILEMCGISISRKKDPITGAVVTTFEEV